MQGRKFKAFGNQNNVIDDYKELIGMIRAMGFDLVDEVAFRADLTAKSYSEIISKNSGLKTISSDRPDIVEFVERSHLISPFPLLQIPTSNNLNS